jgi:glucose/arabinose dehydrogenase
MPGTIATKLEAPWAIAFLPDEQILITERPGRLRLIANDKLEPAPIATIAEVVAVGEGGLLGLAVDPKFNENQRIYLYYTYGTSGNNTLNRVERFRLNNRKLSDRTVIIDAIPGAQNHNGGRIKFGPDGNFYVATGDALLPSLAQDKNSLAGKILRVTTEGQPAPGNPFSNRTYSYGHRNPQGLAWDREGRLWATEHGSQAYDEVNLIKPGADYGWPQVRGDQAAAGKTPPALHSGPTTWAPSGLTIHNDTIYFVGLRGAALFSTKISDGSLAPAVKVRGDLGRLREVLMGPDGLLYLLTSNRDGRGTPGQNDDQLIRIKP